EESDGDETREEESFDPIPRTPKDSEDDGNGEEDQSLRISEEERIHEEEEADELYRMESIFATAPSQVEPLQTSSPIMTPSTIATITPISHAPIPPTTIPSEVLQNLPTFDSVFRFDERLKSLEANFSEYIQTNPFVEAVSNISDRPVRDSYQRENDEFLRTINDNMKRTIKEHVKSQVKEQVSKILPRIEQSVNAQLKAEVLTRSSHSSRTSYAVAADLSEMELKKILIEKIEGNKSIQRSDEQRNLYKAIVEDYEADKIILDTYGERIILKRRRDDDDDDDDQEEPVQTTSPIEEPSHPVFETGAEDQPIVQSSQHLEWFSQPKKPLTLDRDWNKTLRAAPGSTQTWISELAKQADYRSSFNELIDTPLDFSNFIMNRLRVDTLTPELLAGPTYELMKGSCRRVIPFAHFINNDLEYLRGGAFSQKYTTSVTKIKATDYGHIKWIEDLVPRTMWIHEPINYDKHALWGVSHWGRKRQQFYGFAINRESTLDVYSKRRIIAVTDLKIVEWHNYKHLDWISRRVKDLQLGVESYQKRLNLTMPDTYRSNLKRREAYTAYSNPRGFIYPNKDKKNRLMWIDELYKFSDGTLNDVRNAFDDRLKGIRMQYLPQTI
nr:hypothetical protein [Tanacetum cinerariifolium]